MSPLCADAGWTYHVTLCYYRQTVFGNFLPRKRLDSRFQKAVIFIVYKQLLSDLAYSNRKTVSFHSDLGCSSIYIGFGRNRWKTDQLLPEAKPDLVSWISGISFPSISTQPHKYGTATKVRMKAYCFSVRIGQV